MFNSIEEEINVINEIVKQSVIHGGDAGGAYFSNEEMTVRYLQIWLEKKELSDKYKVITKEKSIKGSYIFNTFPKIVPIKEEIVKLSTDWGF